jgi:hypothetical protein
MPDVVVLLAVVRVAAPASCDAPGLRQGGSHRQLTVGLRYVATRRNTPLAAPGSASIDRDGFDRRSVMPGSVIPLSDQQYEVADRLAAEFEGVIPHALVDVEVGVAELELRGQVPAGSLDEMIHRLVEHRLRERAAAGY